MNYDPDNPTPEAMPPQSHFIKPYKGTTLRETHCHSKRVRVPGSSSPHATVALSAYYLAHLLRAIYSSPRNGDWWWEIQYKLREAHLALHEPKLLDNDLNEWEWISDSAGGGEALWHIARHWCDGVCIEGPPRMQPPKLTPEELTIVEEQQRIDAEPDE